jgi:hypothetical protein
VIAAESKGQLKRIGRLSVSIIVLFNDIVPINRGAIYVPEHTHQLSRGRPRLKWEEQVRKVPHRGKEGHEKQLRRRCEKTEIWRGLVVGPNT